MTRYGHASPFGTGRKGTGRLTRIIGTTLLAGGLLAIGLVIHIAAQLLD